MLLVDNKKAIGDDYSNIERVKEIINLNEKEIEILKKANGLRNRITHEYNKTDEKRAKDSIENLLPIIEEIIIKIERHIENEKN